MHKNLKAMKYVDCTDEALKKVFTAKEPKPIRWLQSQRSLIKILTDKKYIKSMDADVTTKILRSNIGKAIRYSQRIPFNIYMNYSLQDNRCIIEFSSKVLLDRYPELININNIQHCFENINRIGFCEFVSPAQ